MPCNRPPWGRLAAVDLSRGEILWQVPAGLDPEHGYFGYGPVLVTAGGLVFHAGTRDRRLRAHDARRGGHRRDQHQHRDPRPR